MYGASYLPGTTRGPHKALSYVLSLITSWLTTAAALSCAVRRGLTAIISGVRVPRSSHRKIKSSVGSSRPAWARDTTSKENTRLLSPPLLDSKECTII